MSEIWKSFWKYFSLLVLLITCSFLAMTHFIQVYLQPLRASETLTEDEEVSVFCNLEDLININKALLSSLEATPNLIGACFLKAVKVNSG